jgi:hypothetical protein
MGLKGVCPKCGVTYYGWALDNPNNQRCVEGRVRFLITENGKKLFKDTFLLPKNIKSSSIPGPMPDSEKTKDKNEKEYEPFFSQLNYKERDSAW